MRDELAGRLLAAIMDWTPEDVARERPDLQAMAAIKYDEYQQFSPGSRFVESLALWLRQFQSISERRTAYDFVKWKLIFCSTAEMNHLIQVAYPDVIRPLLLRRAAREEGLDEWRVARVAESAAFRVLQRQCLFLGLSDGARIDVFRRFNRSLSHEQIWQTYEVADRRAAGMLKELRKDLSSWLEETSAQDSQLFRTVVLIDDFSGSGRTYLRLENDAFVGKIATFHESISGESGVFRGLVEPSGLHVYVVLYLATAQAHQYLTEASRALWQPLGIESDVLVVHRLEDDVRILPGAGHPMESLVEHYYAPEGVETGHTQKGGTDAKFGFARCGLPLVLSHNTPNNSLPILWAAESPVIQPLFPRVDRHRGEP